jgi:hypothetical protein
MNSAGFWRRIHQRRTVNTLPMSTRQPAPASPRVAAGRPGGTGGTTGEATGTIVVCATTETLVTAGGADAAGVVTGEFASSPKVCTDGAGVVTGTPVECPASPAIANRENPGLVAMKYEVPLCDLTTFVGSASQPVSE